jgi:glutathione S-transferase
MKIIHHDLCPIVNKIKTLIHIHNSVAHNIQCNLLYESIGPINLMNGNSYLPYLENEDHYIFDINAIYIFLNDIYKISLIQDCLNNYRINLLESLLDKYFFIEVYKNLNKSNGVSESLLIKLTEYIQRFNEIIKNKQWIQDKFSINDITLFSYLASLDYLQLINWNIYNNLKSYYRRLKSHNIFYLIIEQNLKLCHSPIHYNIIDF